MASREKDDFAASLNGHSVATLLEEMRREPRNEPLLDLRKKQSIHLYPGFDVDSTTTKLACFLFDHVTVAELTKTELEDLDEQLDCLERGTQAKAHLRRQARLMIKKAARFQEETQVLRDEQVLVPIQWQGGLASLFQPQSIGLAGQLIYLGNSEMNDLANEVAGSAPLERINLFSTPFGLSCLREHYPEDIVGNNLAVAVAATEIIGLVELFQMVPIASDRHWHNALSFVMSSRRGVPTKFDSAFLGINVLREALPNLELRSYHDTLEAHCNCVMNCSRFGIG